MQLKGTRLIGAVVFGLALVLVPPVFYVLTVLEPQREHMVQRNYRVLAEVGRELTHQFERLAPLIAFTLVEPGVETDPVSVAAALEASTAALRKAEAESTTETRSSAAQARQHALLERRAAEEEERVQDLTEGLGSLDDFLTALRAERASLEEPEQDLASLRIESRKSRTAKQQKREQYVESERKLARALGNLDRIRDVEARIRTFEAERARTRRMLDSATASLAQARSEKQELEAEAGGLLEGSVALACAETARDEARHLANYLQGLRATQEYRAIEIAARDCGMEPPEVRRGEKLRPRLELELHGVRAPMRLEVCGEQIRTRTAPAEDDPCQTREPDANAAAPTSETNGAGVAAQPISIVLPFAHLAEPLERSIENVFDQLVIAAPDGRILHSSAGGPILEVDALDEILELATPTDKRERLEGFTSALRGEDDEESETAEREVLDVLRQARTEPLEVEIGDRWYRVFAHPMPAQADLAVTLELDEREQGYEWFVLGLVSESTFAASSFAAARTQLAVAVVCLVLILLAWPWLRLGFSGRRERLSVVHVVELVASLGMGVGLITMIATDTVGARLLQTDLDASARSVAAQIEASLRAELRATITALHEARVRICDPSSECVGGSSLSCTLEWGTDKQRDNAYVYPAYDIAFALDELGTQVGKQANYRAGMVSEIRVPTRPYFTRVRDGRIFTLSPDERDQLPEPFFLQRIRTYDHGWRLGVVSIPVTEGSALGKTCETVVAAALTRRFDSLVSTVLPPALGFAVIEDASGEVYFHSDDERSLVENFFEETGRDRRLLSLVRHQRSDFANGHYRTDGRHRFLTWPLRDLPWTLVVFQRSSLYDSLRFDALVYTAAHLAIYVFLFMLLALAVSAATSYRPWSWLWPNRKYLVQYRRSLDFLALVGLVYVAAVLSLRGAWLLLPIVAIPAATLGTLYLALHEKGKGTALGAIVAVAGMIFGSAGLAATLAMLIPTDGSQALGFGGTLLATVLAGFAARRMLLAPMSGSESLPTSAVTHRLMLLFLIGVLVAGPTLAFFKDVRRVQLDRVIRYGQKVAVEATKARWKQLQDDAHRLHQERFAPGSEARVVRAEEARCWGLYVRSALLGAARDAGENESECEVVVPAKRPANGAEPTGVEALSVLLAQQLPSFGGTSRELGRFFEGGSHDGRELWTMEPREPTASTLGSAAVRKIVFWRDGWRIVSPQRRIPERLGALQATLSVLAAALASLLSWWMIALFCSRVFGSNVVTGRPPAVIAAGALPLAVDRLLLAPPGDWRESAPQALRNAKPIQLPVPDDFAPLLPASATEVRVVEGLHRCLLDDAKRAKALEVLETLAGRCRLIVCTDVSPLDYIPPTRLSVHGAKLATHEIEDDERLRWTALLGRFVPTRIAWEPSELPEKSSCERLDERLREECDWSPALATVRDEIARDPRFRRAEIDEDELVRWVALRGEAIYREIWALTPEADRLAIIQLAQGDLLNPRNEASVDRLLRRGLIRRAPHFEVVSGGFAHFVRKAEPRARVQAWEKSASDSTWDLMRVPLFILLGLVVAFVIYAGRDTLDTAAALIPALAAGFPIVLRVVAALRTARIDPADRETDLA